jgi:hypothetical protein
MRVLCVGRHAFLSEHLCRLFCDVGATCEAAVGTAEGARIAAHFEPEAVVCEGDLLSPAALEEWANEPALRRVPVLAVSLTRQPHDTLPVDLVTSEWAAVVYLPALDRVQLASLLASVRRAGGVAAPHGWHVHAELPSARQL